MKCRKDLVKKLQGPPPSRSLPAVAAKVVGFKSKSSRQSRSRSSSSVAGSSRQALAGLSSAPSRKSRSRTPTLKTAESASTSSKRKGKQLEKSPNPGIKKNQCGGAGQPATTRDPLTSLIELRRVPTNLCPSSPFRETSYPVPEPQFQFRFPPKTCYIPVKTQNRMRGPRCGPHRPIACGDCVTSSMF